MILIGGEALLPLGLSIVDVECVMVGHRCIRFFIEKAGTESASIGDCALANRALTERLSIESIAGPYDLEVSSPGLERHLRTQGDFERYCGKTIRLKLVGPQQGRANVLGIIAKVSGEGIEVRFDNQSMVIPLSTIRKAHLIWEDKKHAI